MKSSLITLFSAVSLLPCQVLAAPTAGWLRLPPDMCAPLPTNVLWRASFCDWTNDFEVCMVDGAQGNVAAVADGLRIEKTNEAGYIVVKARKPFEVAPGARMRAVAEVADVTGDPSASVQMLRLLDGKGKGLARPRIDGLGADNHGGQVETFAVNTPRGVKFRKFVNSVARDGGKTSGDTVPCGMYPAIVMAGAPSAATWTDWRVADFAVVRRDWLAYCERLKKAGTRTRDYSTNLVDEAEMKRRIAADSDHVAEIVSRDGFSSLAVDGKPVPCVFYRDVSRPRVNCGRRFAAAGVRLQTVVLPFGGRLDWPNRCTLWKEDGFDVERGCQEVLTALRRSPDAMFMLSISVNPPIGYHKSHPEEVWRNEAGGIVCAQGCHVTTRPDAAKDPKCWPQITPHSKVWLNDTKRHIADLVSAIRERGLSKRIVGVHISGFHDGQFSLPVMDHSPPAQRAYRDWLRSRYGTVQALSEAWGRKISSFDAVNIPVKKEYGNYYTGKDFFPPATDRHLSDYNMFHHRSMIEVQDDLARHVKRCFGKKIVCAKWCMSAFGGGNSSSYDFTPLLKGDGFDILIAQASYGNRSVGVSIPEYRVTASFHEHGKLYMTELDYPTYFSGGYRITESHAVGRGWVPDFGAWAAMNRKAAGQMFAQRQGLWYYDMHGTAYDDDRQLEDIAEMVVTAGEIHRANPDPWRPSAAVIVDEESMLERNTVGRWLFDEPLVVRGQMMRIGESGVPYDIFVADDFFSNPKLADRYRTVVVLGMNRFDPARRKFIKSLLDGNRTVVFVGGSGHLGGARETLGLEVETTPRPAGHEIRPEPGFTAAETRSYIYSLYLGHALGKRDIWAANHHRPVRFSVKGAKGDRVIGRYVESGAPALLETWRGRARVIYVCDIAGLSPALFSRLVRESGGFVPVPPSVAQVEMNGDFVSVHALKAWKGDFRIPFEAEVVNLRSGVRERTDHCRFPVEFDAGGTYWFRLKARRSGVRQDRVYDIRDFGASTGAAPGVNAKAVQKALDDCSRTGGGRVVVPEGVWNTGTIWMRSGVELHLKRGAMLKASSDLADYNDEDAYPENWRSVSEEWNGKHLIIAREAENIAITGPGTIDGNSGVFFEDKPRQFNPKAKGWTLGMRKARDRVNLRPGQMIVMVKCRDIFVGDGLRVQNATCWCLHLYGCTNAVVRGYVVRNGRTDGNTDGIDIDCSHNVSVSDADIFTGDDGIAIRAYGRLFVGGAKAAPPCTDIRIANCNLTAEAQGIRIGVGEGLIRNVKVDGVTVHHGNNGVSFEAFYGKREGCGVDVEDVTFRDFIVRDCYSNYRFRVGGDELKFGVRNVSFKDCFFGASVPGVRDGDPSAGLSDIRFDGCLLSPILGSTFKHIMR